MSRTKELTEEQWAVIEHLFPELQPREDARGRSPADTRAVLNGVLWVLTGGKVSLHADALPGHHLPDAARRIEAVLPEFGQHLGIGIG